MNPLEYGNLIYYNKFYKIYIIQIRAMIIAKINYSTKRNKVDIIKSDKVILSYEDKVINSNESGFSKKKINKAFYTLNFNPKLLLNSLYGRFGMDDRFTYSYFISKESYLKYEEKY